jgi:hypothetical protein
MEKVIHAMENFFHSVEVPDFRWRNVGASFCGDPCDPRAALSPVENAVAVENVGFGPFFGGFATFSLIGVPLRRNVGEDWRQVCTPNA